MAAKDISKLDKFVDRIQREELRAFSGTAEAISKMEGEDGEPDFKALSDLILQDPAMTTHVLRASNSAYRIRRGRTNTVSRAIVMLGFDAVKKICLSCSILNGLLDKEPRTELVSEMAKSFHAAVQSRYLAFHSGEQRTEEIFISALIDNFGEMAFWAFGGKDADELSKAMEEAGDDADKEAIENEILGFSLQELSDRMAEEWGLSSHVGVDENDPEVIRRRKDISSCHRLAKATQKGWDHPSVENVLDELKESTGLKWSSLKGILYVAAKEAATTAASYGANAASEMIAIPDFDGTGETDISEIQKKEKGEEPEFEILEPDPMVQLKCFQKISSLLQMETDITLVIGAVLEGIRKGVGLDRVLFALMQEDGCGIAAKMAAGADEDALLKTFKFEFYEDDNSVFSKIFQSEKPLWVKAEDPETAKIKNIEEIYKVVGDISFFVVPIVATGKCIGAFYADMGISDRELTEELFEMLKQLTVQTSLALTQLELRE